MSRYCKDMRKIIKRLTGQDGYDNHHRRTGEKVNNKEDIKEQEPNDINDKKTTVTITSMISSIMNHISICAISQKCPPAGTGTEI